MTAQCVHEFERVYHKQLATRILPGTFRCAKCGLIVENGGAVDHPRDARDDSYRPDLPLPSSDASTAAWADRVHRNSGA